MTSNCTFVDGLGLELRIINLTHHKRSEAKVDLRGYVTNMSNFRSMLKGYSSVIKEMSSFHYSISYFYILKGEIPKPQILMILG